GFNQYSAWFESRQTAAASLFKPVKRDLFDLYLRPVEAPVLSLVVFVAIQKAAGNPFAVRKCALVHRGDSNLLGGRRARRKRYPEPFAGAGKFVRACGHDEPITGVGVFAEYLIQGYVDRVAVHDELGRGP